jgi:hypothetical protein
LEANVVKSNINLIKSRANVIKFIFNVIKFNANVIKSGSNLIKLSADLYRVAVKAWIFGVNTANFVLNVLKSIVMSKVRCLITDFTYASNDQLDNKALAVCMGLEAHSADFPAPPVAPPTLRGLLAEYSLAMSAYKRGGLDQREHFENSKTALLEALLANANYVNTIANGSAQLIVAAGYITTKTAKAPKAAPLPPKLVIAKHGNGHGIIKVECPLVPAAEYYGLIMTEGQPLTDYTLSKGVLTLGQLSPGFRHVLTKPRKKTIIGLTPGIIYYFYMYTGNATGVSGLSEGVQIMAV